MYPVATYVSWRWSVQEPVIAAPARVLTGAELGDIYLRTGDTQAAIAAYTGHLESFPSDAPVRRSLGLALLSGGRVDEAAESILQAYASAPWLADEPVNPDAFARGAEDLALNIELASAYANRVGSAPAWLLVAVLVQANGRLDLGLLMLDRADEAGLDPAVSVPLRRALSA